MEYHPNLDPKIVDNINRSEKDGGIFIKDLNIHTKLKVHTRNSIYDIEILEPDKNKVMIIGNNSCFLDPTEVYINGSTWGGSMLKLGYIGKGMHLEIVYDRKRITTSMIKAIVICGK